MAKNNNSHGRVPTLIAIGGHEDKNGEMEILRTVAQRTGSRRLVVATLASQEAEAMWSDYRRAFQQLGVRDIVHLNIEERLDAGDDPRLKLLENAGAIFFTGGDQLRLTSKMGGTTLCERIHSIYLE